MANKKQQDARRQLIIRTEVVKAMNEHKAQYHRPRNPRCPECGGVILYGVRAKYKNRPADVNLHCSAMGCDYEITIII